MTHADLTQWDKRARRRAWVVAAIAVAAFLAGILLTVQLNSRAGSEKQRADDAEVKADLACVQLEKLGVPCPFDPAEFRGERGPEGRQGPGPSDAQVASAVAAYLAANPPQPGRTPTEAEVASATAAYLAANPPAAGPQGPQGDQGPGPTDEQVAAAVTAWLAAHPPPYCAPGTHVDEYKPPLDRRTLVVCVKDEEQP